MCRRSCPTSWAPTIWRSPASSAWRRAASASEYVGPVGATPAAALSASLRETAYGVSVTVTGWPSPS